MKHISNMLDEMFRAGIKIEVEGDRLDVEGPEDALDRYLPSIKAHKAEILECLGGDPADSILDALAEYDMLIHRLCDLRSDSQEHREKLLQARRSMAPAELPGDLEAFRQIVNRSERTRRTAA